MIRRPPRSTRTDTLFPYTTFFRSLPHRAHVAVPVGGRAALPGRTVPADTGRRPDEPVPQPLVLRRAVAGARARRRQDRSEEHTSELQSLMRISYAVFCLKKKTNIN